MKCEWDHAPFWAAPVGACCPQENLLLWAAVLPTRAQANIVTFFLALGSSPVVAWRLPVVWEDLGGAGWWGGLSPASST